MLSSLSAALIINTWILVFTLFLAGLSVLIGNWRFTEVVRKMLRRAGYFIVGNALVFLLVWLPSDGPSENPYWVEISCLLVVLWAVSLAIPDFPKD